MGTRKKVLIAAALLFLAAALCVGGYCIYRAAGTASIEQELRTKWGIALPEKRTLKFRARATHQDGHDTYLVYSLGESAGFLRQFTKSNNAFVQRTVQEIIQAVKAGGWLAPPNRVPKKYMPDFTQTYLFCISPIEPTGFFVSGYCMVYFPDSSLLLVCERAYR